MLKYRTFGYGHSFGVLSHYYGREAGLELREDIDTVLEPGMVVSMEVRKKTILKVRTRERTDNLLISLSNWLSAD